jgi:hypothetical protein
MSSSHRKIESARANGAKSRGAHTDQGRQAVALNAVTHGLTAETVVLQNESAEEYQIELLNFLDHFQPQGAPEQHLVRQLAAAGWRLARYTGVESGLLNNKMDQQTGQLQREHPDFSDTQRLAVAFGSLADNGNSLALINRYQARLQNEYQKILKSLSHMQATRRAGEVKLRNRANPVSEQPAEFESRATPPWTAPPVSPDQSPLPDDRNSTAH